MEEKGASPRSLLALGGCLLRCLGSIVPREKMELMSS